MELNRTYPLSRQHIEYYQENGFIKLKDVLSQRDIGHFNEVISSVVDSLHTNSTPMDERDTYGKAFVQITNLWTKDERVRPLVFSRTLAEIASTLMECDGVRLYHDQALFKESSGGYTPWHADQYYWPLSSSKSCTAWIPLQETRAEMGPLEFSPRSHRIAGGRDLEIGDESEQEINDLLQRSGLETVSEPFDCGEVSFHTGWLFHRAGPNISGSTRKVMCVIYMDKDMQLIEPKNEHQRIDWKAWCPDVNPGEVIDSELTPLLYEKG